MVNLIILSHKLGGLLNLGNWPLTGDLNRSMPGLGSPGLFGVDLVCSKDTYT